MSKATTVQIGKSKAPFSWLPNYLVNDPNVSAEALAAALYLNGKPEGWRTRPFDIRKRFGWGDRKWRRVSKELKTLGLLHERKVAEGTILWFELPTDPPVQKSSLPDPTRSFCTVLENKDLTNKDLLNKKENIVHFNKNEIQKAIEESFERLWEYYPVKKGKQNAYKAFLRLTSGLALPDIEKLTKEIWDGLVGMRQEHRWMQEFKQHECEKLFIPQMPHGSTFFNEQRWKDTYETDGDKFMQMLRDKNLKRRSF